MKYTVLLFLVVCWVSAAPNHKTHSNLQKIGVTTENGGGFSIVGSKTASIKKYPYNAAVLDSSGYLLGGGAILNKKWIVTAGWNTYSQQVSSLKVRVGSDNALEGGQLLTLAKMIPHPNYTASDWDWDVALLKVKKNIKFSKKAKAIKVSTVTPKNKSTGTVTGWGSTYYVSGNSDTDKLQFLTIDIYDRQTCLTKWWDEYSLNPRSFCAYKTGCGPCSADFGDPLVQKNKVVGMYLGGYGCAEDYYPGIYSDMPKFSDWIDQTIQKNSDSTELDESDVEYYDEENDDDDDDSSAEDDDSRAEYDDDDTS